MNVIWHYRKKPCLQKTSLSEYWVMGWCSREVQCFKLRIQEHHNWIFQSLVFFDHVVVLNRAVDGNLNDHYTANSCTHTTKENNKSSWLVIDLLGPYEVTHVKIKNRRDCCSKFTKLNKISQNYLLVFFIK